MLERITEHTWYMHHEPATDRPSLGYIRGDRYAFAVEAGASKMHVDKFYGELDEQGLPLPDFTGISHWHWDHSYGAHACRGITVASDGTNAMLRKESAYGWSDEEALERVKSGDDIYFCYLTRKGEYPDPSGIKVTPADIEISADAVIDLGGIHVKLIRCGGPHSADSVLFYVPEEKVLYMGDADCKDLFGQKWEFDEAHMETVGDAIDAIPHFPEQLRPFYELVKNIDFEYAVRGHEDGVKTKRYILELMEEYL